MDFTTLLDRTEISTLENSTDCIFAVSKDFELIYFNPRWRQFAKENNGEPQISEQYDLGSSLLNCLSDPLDDFYIKKYCKVMATGKVWNHIYECSSPEYFREYSQLVYPLYNGQGVLVVNRLNIKIPIKKIKLDRYKPLEHFYRHKTGIIHQCSNCRCIQRVGNPDKWDWVSDWVKQIPENTSHTICPICFDFYWKYAVD